MPTFYITGVAGTGKSTIITELQKKNIKAFDLDQISGICSWQNKKSEKKVAHNPIADGK